MPGPRQSRKSVQVGRRDLFDVGQRFRLAREQAGLLQLEVATKARMRPAQVSLLENGHNIEAQFYARVAKALGFRSVTDLLDLELDDTTRRLLRLWRAMDAETRAVAYRKLKVWLLDE